MARSKASAKKQQKRGVDFKKIKRKVGRKLPPPKNVTNTEIKSKAIILPEQSVASEKAGLAVSKKGLTLKELLQQTSHHNAKVRKDALIGIRDIFLKCPAELRSHKIAVIEKLRERIGDDDKLVRETLFQLLKSVIFPGCKEDNQGPFISLMMAYIFNAMTHLAIDVRLMAFKFFDLVVQNYPSSFSFYAEKILQNYGDILRKNQFYLQEKGKLKNALAGLLRCLSLLSINKGDDGSSRGEDDSGLGVLHAFEPDMPKNPDGSSVIIKKLEELMPVLVSCFQDFVQSVLSMPQLDVQSFDCMLSILESIDLVVRFFAYEIDKSQQGAQVSMPTYGLEAPIQGLTVPVSLKKLFDAFPLNPTHHLSGKDEDKYFVLNIIMTEIFLRSNAWLYPSTLLERFLVFITNALSGKICRGTHSGNTLYEKHLLSLIPFIPKLVLQVADDWKSSILQAFTKFFKSSSPESSLKWVCLATMEDMLVPTRSVQHLDTSDPEILHYQISWIRELPSLLILLDDKHPLRSTSVLSLLLRLGQCALVDSSYAQEYDNMQYILTDFFCTCPDESNLTYGPFIRLDQNAQELSICCLYYFSFMEPLLLKSLTWCCLSHDLEPFVLFRIIEVLHSAYRAGHIQMPDHISFFITLLSCFKVFPANISPLAENEISNRGTFKSITSIICSCLLQMGDDHLVFQILEKVVLKQLALEPSLDNACALLRMLVTLDCKPTRLSQQSITDLSNFLPRYLIDVVSCLPEDDDKSTIRSTYNFYLLPCYFLFHRSNKLLTLVINMMASLVTDRSPSYFSRGSAELATGHSSRISAIVSVILMMYTDVKMRKVLLSCKMGLDSVLQNILAVQSFEEINMIIEERHKIKTSFDRLETVMSSLLSQGQ